MLLEEKNELHNRSMHISGSLKADIENTLTNIDDVIENKTVMHVTALYEECGRNNVFGRFGVERITGLKSTRASEIIKLMLENDVIEPVRGQGKGKYRFK